MVPQKGILSLICAEGTQSSHEVGKDLIAQVAAPNGSLSPYLDDEQIVERVLARETTSESRERGRRCSHQEIRALCLVCAGLSEDEIKKWDSLRTNGRFVQDVFGSLKKRYIGVRISGNDCVGTSSRADASMNTEISRWYECLDCDRVIECRETEIAPKQCSFCNGAVVLTGEPFQATQFTKYFHGPDSFSHYAGAKPLQRAADQKNIYSITARDLFSDPQSKVQTAVFLRKPLTSARSTRADAPAWLKQRADFLKTFTEKRASRSELILSSFYLDGKTDADIAEMLGWSKDSVKKERATLIKQGNEFFRSLKKHPPNSAIDEEHS